MEKTSGKDVALIGDMDSSLPLLVANTPQEVEQQHKAPVLEQRRVDAPAVLPETDTWIDDDLEPHDSTLVIPCGQLLESLKSTGTRLQEIATTLLAKNVKEPPTSVFYPYMYLEKRAGLALEGK